MAPLQLLLLTELLHKLLDLLALLGVVALRIVHQDPLATLITAGWQMWVLVAARAKAPTSRCCYDGSIGQWLVLTDGHLLLLFATALGSGICDGLGDLPYL
jgi:hypothetical protein